MFARISARMDLHVEYQSKQLNIGDHALKTAQQ